MSTSGSTSRTVGSLGSSTDSTIGSVGKQSDFSKKHKKIIRILTVGAYIMSVSTAAMLLSAYYIFIWNPEPTLTSPTPSSHGQASAYYNNAGVGSVYSRQTSSILHAPYPSEVAKQKVSKKGTHHRMPTPQSLVMEKYSGVRGRSTTQNLAPVSPPHIYSGGRTGPRIRGTTPTPKILISGPT